MAATQITDIINPEVLADQTSAKFPDQLVLGNTNIVSINSEVPLGSPGTTQKMPFWTRINAFGSLTEGTAMGTSKVVAKAEFMIVQRAGAAYEVFDTAELVSKADPVGEIALQIGRRAAEYVDNSLVVKLNNTPNFFDASGTGAGTIDQNAVVNAIFTLGDNAGKIQGSGALIMHSKVQSDLFKLGYIQNQYQSGMNFAMTGMVPTFLGLPIITSDLTTVTNVAGTNYYYTYIVGPGALSLFYQRQVMVEFDRDILLSADVIAASVHFAAHLNGFDDLTVALAAEQAKSIHAVVLKTK